MLKNKTKNSLKIEYANKSKMKKLYILKVLSGVEIFVKNCKDETGSFCFKNNLILNIIYFLIFVFLMFVLYHAS